MEKSTFISLVVGVVIMVVTSVSSIVYYNIQKDNNMKSNKFYAYNNRSE